MKEPKLYALPWKPQPSNRLVSVPKSLYVLLNWVIVAHVRSAITRDTGGRHHSQRRQSQVSLLRSEACTGRHMPPMARGYTLNVGQVQWTYAFTFLSRTKMTHRLVVEKKKSLTTVLMINLSSALSFSNVRIWSSFFVTYENKLCPSLLVKTKWHFKVSPEAHFIFWPQWWSWGWVMWKLNTTLISQKWGTWIMENVIIPQPFWHEQLKIVQRSAIYIVTSS